MDDIQVTTSAAGRIFIQAKHSLALATSIKSDLASCIDQFTRQYVLASVNAPLDPGKDRLVIATSQRSPETIRVVLPSLLSKLQDLSSGQAADDAMLNEKEKQAYLIVKTHIERCWQHHTNNIPSKDQVLLLSLAGTNTDS